MELFHKSFCVFLLAGRAEMSNISAMMTMSSTAAGASLDESLSCAGQLSNARWSNGRTQFDQPSRDDEDSSSLIHKFMGSRDVGRLVIGSGGTSSSSDLSADNYKGCSLMELAALSLLLIKVLGSVDLTLIVIIARCFRGSYIKIKIASQKRVALHTKLVVTHRHRFLPSLECCCHPVRNKVSLGRRGCRLSTQVLFLFEISELRNAIGIGGRRACDPPSRRRLAVVPCHHHHRWPLSLSPAQLLYRPCQVSCHVVCRLRVRFIASPSDTHTAAAAAAAARWPPSFL